MRAFVAIDVAEEVRAALAREQTRLRALCPPNAGIRWTQTRGLHLTLKFLGEVASERVPQVAAALQAVAPFESFTVEVKGFGFFPDAICPRVFWAGLVAPDGLRELALRVGAALAKLGFGTGGEPFHPHLTLARFASRGRRRADSERADRAFVTAVGTAGAPAFGRFEVSEFFLFESRLRPSGAEYHKLARFPKS